MAASFFYVRSINSDNKRSLRIGMECSNVPYNWEESKPTDTNLAIKNQQGYYAEGYDVQLAKLIAEKLNLDPVIIRIEEDKLFNALENKQIDVVFSGLLDTEENKKKASFSDIYGIRKAEFGIVVQRSGKYAKARNLTDFNGATLLGQKDTKQNEVIDQIIDVHHLPPVDSIQEMIEALNKHKTDGFVVSLESGKAYERLYPKFVVIKFPEHSGFELGFSGICAGVHKENEKLLENINNALIDISVRQRQKIMDQTISRIWAHL